MKLSISGVELQRNSAQESRQYHFYRAELHFYVHLRSRFAKTEPEILRRAILLVSWRKKKKAL